MLALHFACRLAYPPNESISMSFDPTVDPNQEPIRLDHFLRTMGMFETGGQAKHGIQGNEVKVNGEVETRRRRKLAPADVVEVGGKRFVVKAQK
jgi:ribosome-associated protein